MSPRKLVLAALILGAATAQATIASAQITGYGVTANGTLFTFDVNSTATATTIGNLGIVPEAIDFRPSTNILYAIDVGTTTTQLYTVNTATAAVTPVGPGFPTTLAGSYDLAGTSVGFDFNPKTVQPDSSMRIRLVSNTGANLRLNSDTGLVATVDFPVAYIPAIALSVDAVAYINNIAGTAASGTTALYDIDFANDQLALQNPPNDGTLSLVGPLGVDVLPLAGVGFDIYTDPTSVDSTIGGDTAFAVFRRPGTSPLYLLYDVNLGTGAAINGRLVGGGLDFTGGFAVVPEPSSVVLACLAVAGLGLIARRRSALAV
jgi:hypothetical protein